MATTTTTTTQHLLPTEATKPTRIVKPKAKTSAPSPTPGPTPTPPATAPTAPTSPTLAVAPATSVNPDTGAGGGAGGSQPSAPPAPVAVTFASVFMKLSLGIARYKEITADLKVLQKDTARIAKESVRRPRRVADPSAEPSGFRKPVGLSPEMAAFVGVDIEAKVSRNNVTKAVTTYIKAHNLQDTPDKRVILPDANLRALLGIDDQKLTYFNLQSFLKKHFLKAVPEVPGPAVPIVTV